MLDKDKAKEIIGKLASYTDNYAVASVMETEQDTTRFANSEISQNTSISDAVASITVYDGKKEASCSGNVLTDEGLRKLASDADEILKYVPDGDYEAFKLSSEDIKEFVSDGGLRKAFGVNERARLVADGVSGVAWGFTSAGALTFENSIFALGDKDVQRYTSMECLKFNTVVTHESGAAGGGECISYSADGLDIAAEFAKAKNDAKLAIGPVPIDTGAYTVVLSPVAFGNLLMYVTWMLNAKTVDDGISFAVGKLGEKVFGENITIRDDVNYPGSQPFYFDFEGNKRKVLPLIEKGVIKNILHDNKTAAKQKINSTGHAVSNTGRGGFPMNAVMDAGDKSLEEIIRETPKGIFINEFHYTNFVNPRILQITGLTRNGAFLIENGRLTKPVTTMRFTQNMVEGLNNVSALSSGLAKINVFDRAYMVPAARIENFRFTSRQ